MFGFLIWSSWFCYSIPLESIFNNIRGEVVKNENGKIEILGSSIETAILEFGLSFGGDFHIEGKKNTVVNWGEKEQDENVKK